MIRTTLNFLSEPRHWASNNQMDGHTSSRTESARGHALLQLLGPILDDDD
jgi:hypothetical protein